MVVDETVGLLVRKRQGRQASWSTDSTTITKQKGEEEAAAIESATIERDRALIYPFDRRRRAKDSNE